MQVSRYSQEEPARYFVELVGAIGIGPAALAPAFELLVCLDNGHIFDMNGGCNDIIVSYAGVPLTRGRILTLCVMMKKVAMVTTSGGVAIPEDLLRLMSDERRRSGVARLEVDLWLQRGWFTCSIELNGEWRASECKEQNFIDSS
ncbi:unnamed protein product [Urochloa humidicola]